MENKNTKELRGYKAGLKSKLMGAVAMLLVSAIMVSSATYAWFVLSTHPEVKGMSTTVGSNGALEIALLNNETGADLSKITTSVGDSSNATGKSTATANVTWGNIVDLSDDATYGLNTITLYPAVLNYDLATATLGGRDALLKYAEYGTDGRVSKLNAGTTSGTYTASGFVSDINSNDYGVRAIGTANKVDPFKNAFNTAKKGYETYAGTAVTAANATFSNNLTALVAVATTHYVADVNEFTKAQYGCIGTALDGLATSVSAMETALKNAIAARINAEVGNKTDDLKEEDLVKAADINLENYTSDSEYGTYIETLSQLKTDISATKAQVDALPETQAAWSAVRVPYAALMGMDGEPSEQMMVSVNGNNYSFEELKAHKAELLQAESADVTVKSGLFKRVADITGEMKGTVKVSMATGNGTVVATDPTMKSLTDQIVAAYQVPAGQGGAAASIITTAYGYAVDLAFKTNAANNELRLSTATSRIANNTDANVQGVGSTFTFTGTPSVEDMQKAARALRVVFVDQDLKITAVAAIDQTADAIKADTYKYDLHVYNVAEYTAHGGIKLGTAVANDAIKTLNQDEATALSAIVYLDGEFVDYAINRVEGTLNLQFCGSETLTPMTYDFSAGGDQQP